jgi:hypothetical protein
LARSFVHAQRLVGADKIAKPNSNWTPEQWATFYNDLGRPADASGYVAPTIEGFEFDPALVGGFQNTAHQLGLTAQQAAGILEYYGGAMKTQIEEVTSQGEAQYEEAVTALKSEFGQAYDVHIERAKRAVDHFGGEGMWEAIDKAGLGNNVEFVKAMTKVGTILAEEGPPDGERTETYGMTPAQAQAQMGQLKADPEFMKAWKQSHHPSHKEAVERWSNLAEAAFSS